MLNPALTRLELPGRREQYEGLIHFVVNAAAQAVLAQLQTASQLAVHSAAMCTDRKSAEKIGEQLEQLLFGLVVRPVVRGEYVDCWQQKPRDDDAAGYRNNHTPAAQPAPWPAAQPAAQTAAEPAAQHAQDKSSTQC
jgi:hypothetical protein